MSEAVEKEKRWSDDVHTAVLKTYLLMAHQAKSEAVFKASLALIVQLIDEVDYLGEQGK